MPTLQLRLSPTPSIDRSAGLAAALTRLTAEILGKRAEVTAVLVQPLDSGWFIGAAAVTEPTALLEIDITAGTNTAAQKAEYIRAVHDELSRQLGALAAASYVIVRELPAGDWGYGGQTQLARQRARQRASEPLSA